MPRRSDPFITARAALLAQRYHPPRSERPAGEAWVLDSYRVRCWYYRDAPAIGDKVTYLRDGFSTRITSVTFFRISFACGTSMRRPEVGRRLGAWVLPRLHTMIARRPEAKRTISNSSEDVTRTRVRNRLRPDVTTLYV